MTQMDKYKAKVKSPADAIKLIKDGNRVMVGHAIGEPKMLLRALAENYKDFKDVELTHEVYNGEGLTVAPEMAGHFHHNVIFADGTTRKAVQEGRADFMPTCFHELPQLIDHGYFPVDVFIAQCTPPDKFGFVNLGISCDYAKMCIEKAAVTILEVNDQMPTTFGETFVHVDEITAFIETSYPLREIPVPVIGDTEMKIGKFVSELIPDGACLQLGIGSLPDAILNFLGDKKDLGIHSEMVSDGVIPLIESGVINGKKKQVNPGKIAVTFLMGTQKLYDFVDKNPAFLMLPVDKTNAPEIACLNENLIAVNSCVEVDLMGQVCSEAIGLSQHSGIGGQLDFCRAANRSKGGKAILCTPSVTKNGKISKIVPFLNHGAPVTTDRCDVNYIVTEYGVAQLKGKNLRQRATALIKIAHPDFRPSLIEEFERRFNQKFED